MSKWEAAPSGVSISTRNGKLWRSGGSERERNRLPIFTSSAGKYTLKVFLFLNLSWTKQTGWEASARMARLTSNDNWLSDVSMSQLTTVRRQHVTTHMAFMNGFPFVKVFFFKWKKRRIYSILFHQFSSHKDMALFHSRHFLGLAKKGLWKQCRIETLVNFNNDISKVFVKAVISSWEHGPLLQRLFAGESLYNIPLQSHILVVMTLMDILLEYRTLESLWMIKKCELTCCTPVARRVLILPAAHVQPAKKIW